MDIDQLREKARKRFSYYNVQANPSIEEEMSQFDVWANANCDLFPFYVHEEIAKMNDWIDGFHLWLRENINRFNPEGTQLALPWIGKRKELVGIMKSSSAKEQDIAQIIADAKRKKQAAKNVAESARHAEFYYQRMPTGYLSAHHARREKAVISAIRHMALAISRYYSKVIQCVPYGIRSEVNAWKYHSACDIEVEAVLTLRETSIHMHHVFSEEAAAGMLDEQELAKAKENKRAASAIIFSSQVCMYLVAYDAAKQYKRGLKATGGPVASTEGSPVASTEGSLVASTEGSPMASTKGSPMASTKGGPVASTEGGPVASTEGGPVASTKVLACQGLQKGQESWHGVRWLFDRLWWEMPDTPNADAKSKTE